MKKKLVVGAVAAVVSLGGLLLVARSLWPANVAETAPDHAEAALRTRRYRTDLPTFAVETLKIVPQLTSWGRNWSLVTMQEQVNFSVLIKAEVPVVVFTDDLVVKAERDAATGELIVNVRSRSRVGQSDFGENRRHVLKILAALDEKFGTGN